jgi:phosphotransferase system enzyme I (PtsI)
MKILKGKPVSSGIGIGEALLYDTREALILKEKVDADLVKTEINRFNNAVKKSKAQLKKIYNNVLKIMGTNSALIIETQRLLLKDGNLINDIKKLITTESIKAEWAIKRTEKKYVDLFSKIEDLAFQEKRNDISDIFSRILKNLKSSDHLSNLELVDDVILIAKDIPPSIAANIMSKGRILGLVLEKGGETSHLVILAKTLGIPTLIGVEDALSLIENNQELIVDSFSAELVLSPNRSQISEARIKLTKFNFYQEKLKETLDKPDLTRDNFKFTLSGNIELPFEADLIKSYNARGIGLFRTEFLLANQEIAKNYKDQELIYKSISQKFLPDNVVIRTFDVGRDKTYGVFTPSEEENPSLGTMAIRLFLKEEEIFKTQIKAVILANQNKNIKLLFPMITEVEEIFTIKRMIREITGELCSEEDCEINIPDIGIMIETPAAVKIIKYLEDLVDFFSIGTNDLVQYMLAVDRNNSNVSYLYNPFHPAVIETLFEIHREIKKINKEVNVCGEMASKVFPALMLLGIGYTNFSMDPMSIAKIKSVFNNIDHSYIRLITRKLTRFRTKIEVEEFFIESMFKKYPQVFSKGLII